MFSEEFFPTPESVIKKMLAPYASTYGYKLSGKTILEPSAGKGDILDFITGHNQYDEWHNKKSHIQKERVYAIEQNEELTHILSGKGYRVIGNDFLEYKGDYLFDLILMNPPFSNGDEHLLKAWEILEEGEVICLLNAETIKNPYTRRRKLLQQLISQHGEVEYLGNCFSDAQRRTDVDIALVRMKKAQVGQRFNFFEGKQTKENVSFDENTIQNQVARIDVLGNMEIQYNRTKEAFVNYMKAKAELCFYASPLETSHNNILGIVEAAEKKQSNNDRYNTFIDGLKAMSWRKVFDESKLKSLMTGKVRSDFEAYSKTQGYMDFTVENVDKMFETLFLNKWLILERCLLDVFDKLTSFDKKNKIHWEGWKTNDCYKVNRKVIVPRYVVYDWGSFRLSYYRDQVELDDIDKVMCMLTGKKFDAENFVSIRSGLEESFKTKSGIAESDFFNMRYFKKGTLHLVFKDVKLWERFNVAAAKGKNWLPEETTKKAA